MILDIYAVYDRVAEVYTQPMFFINLQVAQRIMRNCVNNPQHNYSLNPEDFALYKLGIYDDSNGMFTTDEPKKVLDLVTLSKQQTIETGAQLNG